MKSGGIAKAQAIYHIATSANMNIMVGCMLDHRNEKNFHYQLFSPIAIQMQLPIITFAFSMLLATRITNFAYPGANMFAAMGFAGSENIKAMIKNGLTVTVVQLLFLVLYSICL